MISKTYSVPNGSYALFLDKINQQILTCKTFRYMGGRIFCVKKDSRELLPENEIYRNIDREKKIITAEYKDDPAKNLRLLKISNNSMYHICDNHFHDDNFIGGHQEKDEEKEEKEAKEEEKGKNTLCRELREELFINDEEEEQKRKIQNILSNLITNIKSGNKRIFLINFNGLDESLQKFLNDGVSGKIKFQKNIKMCGNIDATEGEIHKLIWLSKEDFLKKLETTLKKFNRNSVLSNSESEFNKFLTSTRDSDIATFDNVKVNDKLEAISDLVPTRISQIKKGEICIVKRISKSEVIVGKGRSTIDVTADFKKGFFKKIISGGFYEKYIKYKNKYLTLKNNL